MSTDENLNGLFGIMDKAETKFNAACDALQGLEDVHDVQVIRTHSSSWHGRNEDIRFTVSDELSSIEVSLFYTMRDDHVVVTLWELHAIGESNNRVVTAGTWRPETIDDERTKSDLYDGIIVVLVAQVERILSDIKADGFSGAVAKRQLAFALTQARLARKNS